MDEKTLCRMSALEIVSAIKKKKVSPSEVTDAFLARIERLNPRVNAFCTVAAESARRQAKKATDMVMGRAGLGPLHGVPVAIKDSVYTAGIRSTIGSKLYENFVPEQDAIVVERLKKAGAIVIGKTNTPEFCLMGTTDNFLFGVTRNPWNLDFTPGGSSGGSGAAVAACMSPIAIGSDGGGSIRLPSSFCGIFGLKPSFGRVPQYPNFPGWDLTGLIHTGPMTRSVKDAALCMNIIAGRDDRDPTSLPDTKLDFLQSIGSGIKGLKIAWSKDLGYAKVDPRVLKLTEAAVKSFASLGCSVEEATPEGWSLLEAYFTILGVAHASVLKDIVKERRNELHHSVAYLVESTEDKTALEYLKARAEQMKYWEKVEPFFEKYDLLLTPTIAIPPFKVGEREVAKMDSYRGLVIDWKNLDDWIPFTHPFNATGQPAASVPCGWTDDGLPVGLQIVGRRFDDVTVLKAAAAFEQVSPWANKFPPLE